MDCRFRLAQFVGPSAIHAHALHVAHADQLDADIIAAIPLIGKRDRVCAAAVSRSGFHVTISAISAPLTGPCRPSEHSSSTSSTCTWRSSISTFTKRSLPSERLSRWRVSASAASRCGEQTHAHLFGDHGMVARDLRREPVADQVAAGIAHMRDHHAIVAESAGHDGGRHARTAGAGCLAQFVDARVGGLHEARHQNGVRLRLWERREIRRSGFRRRFARRLRRVPRRPRHRRAQRASPASRPSTLGSGRPVAR